MQELKDESIIKYINELYAENGIRFHEDAILNIMKLRASEMPCEKNNDEWLNFSAVVIQRRNISEK
jgi:hypothetical protein